MSIEKDLSSIAASLQAIAEFLTKQAPAPVPEAPRFSVPQTPDLPPIPQTPPPSAQVVPMPAPQAPQPAPQAYPVSPLNTPNDVMQYCAHKYSVLGPAKGAQMQAVLTALGHATLNTLKPEQYAEFYAKVEAIA